MSVAVVIFVSSDVRGLPERARRPSPRSHAPSRPPATAPRRRPRRRLTATPSILHGGRRLPPPASRTAASQIRSRRLPPDGVRSSWKIVTRRRTLPRRHRPDGPPPPQPGPEPPETDQSAGIWRGFARAAATLGSLLFGLRQHEPAARGDVWSREFISGILGQHRPQIHMKCASRLKRMAVIVIRTPKTLQALTLASIRVLHLNAQERASHRSYGRILHNIRWTKPLRGKERHRR
jgi:hypothetical protein